MPSLPPSPSALHWDGTITAGNVLTALAMMVAVMGVWFRLENRVEFQTERLAKLEAARERDDRETALQMAAFATLRANQEAMLNSQLRMERALETLTMRFEQRPQREAARP